MTIKEFAKHYNCTTQTLRYYDKIGLIKPVKVDRFTGYRHYDEEQILDFVKIKNLQRASFSLDEIRTLLSVPSAIIEAFDKKIKEHTALLQSLKKIQRSYQEEYMSAKLWIEDTKKRIRDDMDGYDPTDEFGINKETYHRIISKTCNMFEALDTNASTEFDGKANNNNKMEGEEDFEPQNDPSYLCVYEKYGWKNVKDFLNEVLILENGEYLFCFWIDNDKHENVSFCNTVLGLAIDANPDKKLTLGCIAFPRKDDVNRFCLYKRKQESIERHAKLT